MSLPRLSPRQQQILDHARAGHTNKQIASTLHLSQNTINKHRQKIFKKLLAHNTPHAVDIYHTTYLKLYPISE